MKARYKQREDGEGWSVRSSEQFRIACCDCGLVHDVLVVAKGKEIGIAARRNNRATAQRRRKKK